MDCVVKVYDKGGRRNPPVSSRRFLVKSNELILTGHSVPPEVDGPRRFTVIPVRKRVARFKPRLPAVTTAVGIRDVEHPAKSAMTSSGAHPSAESESRRLPHSRGR